MIKSGWKILKRCPHYKIPENPSVDSVGFCTLDDQIGCTGEIPSCMNPEVLREYVLERGLGWQRKKGKDRFKRALQGIGRLATLAGGEEKTEPTKIFVHERCIFL